MRSGRHQTVKITDVRCTIVAVPTKRGYKSTWRRTYHGILPMVAVLVEIDTDVGLVGIGEAPATVGKNAGITVDLIQAVKHILLGRDPHDLEVLKREMHSHAGLPHLGVRGLVWAFSGIDMALWDLVGKAADLPLSRLWGGQFRERVPFYADIPPGDPDEMAKDAREFHARGFRTFYLKVGFDPALDAARVASVRASIDPDAKLRIDANQAWSPGMAKRMIGRLAQYDLEYVEQPVSMHNLDDLAAVRQASPVPILAHESTYTFYDALNVIKRSAADALQLDPRFDSGFLGCRLSAGMAEAAGLPVVTHTFGELGVATAAFMQLISSCPNFILANQTYYWNLEDDVIEGGLMEFEGEFLHVPGSPGIGVNLDKERVAKYAALYEESLRGAPDVRSQDPYYDNRYLLFPRY